MAEIAQSMGTRENTTKILNKDDDIRSFADLKRWWSNPNNQRETLCAGIPSTTAFMGTLRNVLVGRKN
jgi:hypothetical protein